MVLIGLIINKHDRYVWILTECNEDMLQWVIDNELQDIAVARKSPYFMITIVRRQSWKRNRRKAKAPHKVQ